MSNKLGKTGKKKSPSVNVGAEVVSQIMEYLLALVLMILCVAVSFYAEDGYHQIGNAKFAAYRTVMSAGFGTLFVGAALYCIFWLKEHRKPEISVTDGFVFAYLILTGVSVVSGGFYEDALWGCNGWNMGFMSQLSFVLLYLFVSRFGRYYHIVVAVLCGSAGIVYIIGILHRLMIDPIGFYDGLENSQKAQFLSTLGQASWYGSFLAVTLPVGMGVFLYTRKTTWRMIAGIYMITGFCTLVTQNSDSAYFALAGALFVFFMISSGNRGTMCRFMGALTLFFGSGKIMYFLTRIRPNPMLEADFVTRLMWTSGVTWVLLAFCLSVTIVLYFMGKKEEAGQWRYPTELMTGLCRIVPIVVVVVTAGTVLVICLQTKGVFPGRISDRLSEVSYLNWNDGWGNGRGRIWRFSAKMYAEEKMGHKLFGVGPDCFNSYVSAHYSEESALLWGKKQLTNAHNEWLNMLINGGILGLAAYGGIYVTMLCRCFRGRSKDVLLAGIAAACASYMCYNFFCYQQVLCTPFIFILMGIGEYILRQSSSDINQHIRTRRGVLKL